MLFDAAVDERRERFQFPEEISCRSFAGEKDGELLFAPSEDGCQLERSNGANSSARMCNKTSDPAILGKRPG